MQLGSGTVLGAERVLMSLRSLVGEVRGGAAFFRFLNFQLSASHFSFSFHRKSKEKEGVPILSSSRTPHLLSNSSL